MAKGSTSKPAKTTAKMNAFEDSSAFSQTLVASKVVKISQLVSPSSQVFRIYSYPFALVYAAWVYVRFWHYDRFLGSSEFALLSFLIVAAIHVLSYLVCLWSVQARVALTCIKQVDPFKATAIMILPVPDSGSGALCDLKRSEITNTDGSKESQIYFLYQQKKYIFNTDKKRFEKLDYLSSHELDMHYYKTQRGIATDQMVQVTHEKYGSNRFEVPIPTFQELFKEHVVAPFFVFQLFCVALWFLDEMWYYSLFTLSMLFVFESTVVFQRLRNLQEFRAMSIKPYPIHVYRGNKWVLIQTDELLPGDLCSVTRQKDESPVPADMILVDGSCIANEAMLSGESTPQLKEPISLRDDHEIFDPVEDKNHVLFGGTKILQVTSPEDSSAIQTPDKGCLALVLRTGFATQQGKLVRTIVYSTERVSANNAESLFFILFLLIFAIIASWYVWTTGSKDEERNQSKLLLHCVLIITSVVPPELPMELSLAVNNSLVSLARAYVFCTEPFRIPFAGRIDIACFDKTGTLTAENLIVEGVTGLTGSMDDLSLPTQLPIATTHVLAAAHALVRLEDGVIGDPMEKNTLESIRWMLDSGDIITPKPEVSKSISGHCIKVQRRFPFSSSLKRMSTISLLEDGSAQAKTLISAKGAPETIKGMLRTVPKDYDEHYKYWARRGKRVLALAYKHAPKMTVTQIRDLTREQTEKDLVFAGFLIFYCPLKPDSINAIRILNESLHRVVMITGDNALTASHIAREVEIVQRDVLVADVDTSGDLVWETVDEKVRIQIDTDCIDVDSRLKKYDLGCTGLGLDALINTPCFNALLPRMWVYARVSPSQKELILTRLKQAGYFTLMCGDGTNDVGALKQAHVGIALLDTTPEDLQKIGVRMREKHKKAMLTKQNEMLKKWGLPPVADSAGSATGSGSNDKKQGLLANTSQAAPVSSATTVGTKSRPANNAAPLTNMMDMMMEEMDDDIPKIKFGDASVAAPFTSKISSVMSVVNIVRQGRATLVAMVQMYKILGLNSLIMAYSLSVLHLAGIKQGDWQATIAGFMITICFFGIAKSEALEKLSRQRPQPNIFNLYIVLSVLGQAAIHIAALIYIRLEAIKYSEAMEEVVPLDAEFTPNLLNSAVYLVSLIMQISTFAINYQGQPFRESLFRNKAMFNSLVIVGLIAFGAAMEISDELNDWMQLVEFPPEFKRKLLITMTLDYGVAWAVEMGCSWLFADNKAKASLFPVD
ncbi:putative cation-transporting ATPase 1 [Batrachochytrium dendrobatidis]|nr:putative cation-transporting ATPase 1 [Batrachochytrium dendrobatidis]KAK5664650.1 putative cation-transporting ATPase 1 [Batrachochytrium dendrobatidis]